MQGANAEVVNRMNKCSENNVGSQYRVTGLNISMAAASAVVVAEKPSRVNHNIATPVPSARNTAFMMNAICCSSNVAPDSERTNENKGGYCRSSSMVHASS